jgi:hypothetical protein
VRHVLKAKSEMTDMRRRSVRRRVRLALKETAKEPGGEKNGGGR